MRTLALVVPMLFFATACSAGSATSSASSGIAAGDSGAADGCAADASASVIASGPCKGTPSLGTQFWYPQCQADSKGACADPNCAPIDVEMHDMQCASSQQAYVGCAPLGMLVSGHSEYLRECDSMVINSAQPAYNPTGLVDAVNIPQGVNVKWACN